MALTTQQKRALACLRSMSGHPVGPKGLGLVLETGPEGAAATAGSLVRRGLAERVRVRGKVQYRITSAGRKVANDAIYALYGFGGPKAAG